MNAQFQRRAGRDKKALLAHMSHISHASKVMFKFHQARLQQYMNNELPDVQARFRKDRGTRDQISTSIGSQKRQENFLKVYVSIIEYA